jgi:hypothetical protein
MDQKSQKEKASRRPLSWAKATHVNSWAEQWTRESITSLPGSIRIYLRRTLTDDLGQDGAPRLLVYELTSHNFTLCRYLKN